MIVTISSMPAAGKSTVARMLAKKLNVNHYSAGDFQRQIAKEKGMTITQLGELEAKDKKLDLMVDQRTKEIAKKEKNVVFDAWLAPYALPDSFKIFLTCDENVAAKRRLVPVYCVAESSKFDPLVPGQGELCMEQGFDWIPADLITDIVTEAGIRGQER